MDAKEMAKKYGSVINDLPSSDEISCPFCGGTEFCDFITESRNGIYSKCCKCGKTTIGLTNGVHFVSVTNLQIYHLAIDADTEIKYNELKDGNKDLFKEWLEEISPISTEFNKMLFRNS